MRVVKYIVIGSFLVGIVVTFVDRGLLDNFRMKEHLITIKKANRDLARENVELRKKISQLKNDLSYIESVARNELGMVKKGDLVLQFER